MREQGDGIVQKRVIVGLHDFEQAYRDIFRTCWVHAHKHVHKAVGLLPYWQRMYDENGDPDFAVALHGYFAGLVTPRPLIRIDREAVTTLAKDQLVVMGVDEKPPLAPDALSADDVGLMIEGFQVSPEHRLAHPKYYRRYVGEATARNQKLARLGEIKAQVGWLRLTPWVTGWGLGWVGTRLRLWASQ